MVKIYLEDENKTKEIGYKLGNLLTPGSVICLIGDLGAGKTTMTQSLAKALEVDDYITSPTFTIVNEYKEKCLYIILMYIELVVVMKCMI